MLNFNLKFIYCFFIFLLLGFSYVVYDRFDLFNFIKIQTSLIFLIIPILYYFKFLNKKYEAPLIPLFSIYLIIFYIFPFGFFENEMFESFFKICVNKEMIVPAISIDIQNPIFCNEKDLEFSNKFINLILIICFLFFLGFILSRVIVNFIKFNFKILDVENIRDIKIFTFILLIVIFFKKFIFEGHVPLISQSMIPLSYLMTGFCCYLFVKEKKILLKILLLTPILIIVLKDIMDGYVFFSLMISFYSLILYFIFSQRFPIIPIFIVFILINFAHVYKYDYRKNIYDKENISYSEKIKIYKQSADNIYANNKFKENLIDNLQRIAHPFQSLTIVVKRTPEKVPYWGGSTYKIFLTKFIPRVFWKNKPSDQIGNIAGKRYNVLGSHDIGTSWNFPVINEFYANFGVKGIIIGMFLIGFIFSIIGVLFRSSSSSNIVTIFGMIFVFKLFFLESHFSMVFGNLIQNFILLVFLLGILNFKKIINVKSIISNK
jgi:hypothetical protein